MSTIVYAPSLGHLGPGSGPQAEDVINFDRTHFAVIEDDDPLLNEKLAWVAQYGAVEQCRIVTEAEATTLRAVAAAIYDKERQDWGLS